MSNGATVFLNEGLPPKPRPRFSLMISYSQAAEQVMPTARVSRHELAASLKSRREELVALWLDLGDQGPFYDAAPTDPATRRDLVEGYLRPLARLLADSIEGSALHRSLYLDMRVFHLQDHSPADRPAVIGAHLTTELEAIASLVGYPHAREALQELHRPLLLEPSPDAQRLLMIGDCIMSETRLFLQTAYTSEAGLQTTHVNFHADHRGFRADEVLAQIERTRPTLIGLSLFSHNATPGWVALRLDTQRGLSRAAMRKRATGLLDSLREAVAVIRTATDAPIIVHSPAAVPLSRKEFYRPGIGIKRLVREMNTQLNEFVNASENVLLLDEAEIAQSLGGRRSAGGRVLAAQYRPAWIHPLRMGPALAEKYADVLASVNMVVAAKALLVDFDNTLWDGVMADGPVVHHREEQELLRELRRAGVLLIALSKNDPANIRWDEMALKPDDFVLHKISWRPKPEAVAEAIQELDLAAGAFILLDDNPAERALVEENVVGVRALDPADPFAWRTLRRWLAMPSTKRTPEAMKRTEIYREAAERRRAMGEVQDYGEMLATLKLRADIRQAQDTDLERVLELVQRTNQFNTTTRRRHRAELRELMLSQDHDVVVASMRDRFGALGVVAVVIVDRSVPGVAEIDSFVMSCRAMGFGLEYLLLNHLTTQQPDSEWRGCFVPTDRNAPAAGMYDSAGFRQDDGSVRLWTLASDAARPQRPAWFD
jgi:FkbH-like protein